MKRQGQAGAQAQMPPAGRADGGSAGRGGVPRRSWWKGWIAIGAPQTKAEGGAGSADGKGTKRERECRRGHWAERGGQTSLGKTARGRKEQMAVAEPGGGALGPLRLAKGRGEGAQPGR